MFKGNCNKKTAEVPLIMKTRLSLKPGDKGTKKLADKYGSSLVCIRYRYDEKRKKRLKTVDLIIEETDWEPACREKKKSVTDDWIVGVRVSIAEKELQKKIKAAGGKRDSARGLWIIRYETAEKLGPEDRCAGVVN